jgi:hypothetical protein
VLYLIYQEEGKEMPKVREVVVASLVAEVEDLVEDLVEEVAFANLWNAMEDALKANDWDLYSDLHKERYGVRP